MALFNQLQAVQRLYQAQLMAKAGVIGVGIGLKESGGRITDQLALVALVERKQPEAALSADDQVPRQLDGLITDVREVGVLRAQNVNSRSRWRNIIPAGVSIGHYLVTAGTLGAIVYDPDTNFRYLLSNNHVLADNNDGLIGDPILQPAATDGGQNPQDIVARLETYLPLHFIGEPAPQAPPLRRTVPNTPPPPTTPDIPPPPPPLTPPTTEPPITPPNTEPPPTSGQPDPAGCDVTGLVGGIAKLVSRLNSSQSAQEADSQNAQAASAQAAPAAAAPSMLAQQATPENRIDAALAMPLNPGMFSNEILQLGQPRGTRPPQLGLRVRKMGRTTGLTFGSITLLNATVDVGYNTRSGPKTARFTGQVMASGMSQGGDSGSLVVAEDTMQAVGLLFAGSGIASIFTPIDWVLEALNVRL